MPPSLTARHYLIPAGDLAGPASALGATGRIMTAVASGAAANTNLAVPGIQPGDLVQEVLQFTVTTGNFTDVVDQTANVSAISAGNIQLSVVTTGRKLLIRWLDKKL